MLHRAAIQSRRAQHICTTTPRESASTAVLRTGCTCAPCLCLFAGTQPLFRFQKCFRLLLRELRVTPHMIAAKPVFAGCAVVHPHVCGMCSQTTRTHGMFPVEVLGNLAVNVTTVLNCANYTDQCICHQACGSPRSFSPPTHGLGQMHCSHGLPVWLVQDSCCYAAW